MKLSQQVQELTRAYVRKGGKDNRRHQEEAAAAALGVDPIPASLENMPR